MVWFRSDLRVGDNLALNAAGSWADGGVVGVFVISPGQWWEHDWGGAKVEFLLRNLRELSAGLARLNVPLVILRKDRFEGAAPRLVALAERHGCTGLFFNREYELNEARRDEAVAASMQRAGIEVRSFDDQVVLAPGSVRTAQDRPFTVFTPFRKAWIRVLRERGGLPRVGKLKKQPATGIEASEVPVSVRGFESRVDPRLWPGGERAARRQLARFVESRIRRYKTDRDLPAIEGTSALSPYLSIGAISVRQCLAAAVKVNGGKIEGGRSGADAWITELVWREFYKHLLQAFPRLSRGRAFKPATERIPWRYNEKDFAAWGEGRTGVPIVDAAMRQLNATGWMHNRLRMVAAMFLTKDLLIDWRWGERYFMQRLVDGDLASNNGGWQWSASTGTDAAPYFRMFNPVSQSLTCDPRGDFIRHWVEELRGIDAREIHDPPAGARLRVGYPKAIVDHARARQRVMNVFRRLRGVQ